MEVGHGPPGQLDAVADPICVDRTTFQQMPGVGIQLVAGLGSVPMQGTTRVVLVVADPGELRNRADGIREVEKEPRGYGDLFTRFRVGWKAQCRYPHVTVAVIAKADIQ